MKEYGIQTKIALITGVDQSIISFYFNSKPILQKHKSTIENCLINSGRSHLINKNATIKKTDKKKILIDNSDKISNIDTKFINKVSKGSLIDKHAVRMYFNGKKFSDYTTKEIEKYLTSINYIPDEYESKIISYKPKNQYRGDIIKHLIHGDIRRISNDSGVDIQLVRRILESKSERTNDKDKLIAVIKTAEKRAAINIWKAKYCKFESML